MTVPYIDISFHIFLTCNLHVLAFTIVVCSIIQCNFVLNVDQCSTGAIRLSPFNSYYNTFERLEICYNGHWGKVCNNYADSETANVACRQLGHREG